MEELSANGLWPREGMPFQPQEDTENGGCFPPQAISRSAEPERGRAAYYL